MPRVEALEAAGKPGAATQLRKTTRTFLEWCVTKGLVQLNVLAGLKRPATHALTASTTPHAREKPSPMPKSAPSGPLARGLGSFGGLVRLAMLTGMRRAELAGLTWADVHDDRIVVQPHAPRPASPHAVPLTPLMRNVLAAQPRPPRRWCFRRRESAAAQLAGGRDWSNG